MACERCYEIYFRGCEVDITFPLGLTPDTAYTLIVSNQPTGRQYVYATTSDAEGSLVWPTDDQPAGLFIPHNGVFSMSIEDENGDQVEFTIGANDYSCVQFQFIDSVNIPIA